MKPLQFIALILTAVALMPAGAHLFALPNKLHMAQADYFIAQSVYYGWALFGFVLIANLAALAALAYASRAQRPACVLVLVSLACQIAVLALFFAYVLPANQATANWTQVPANWEAWRRQWEYGHAINALISLAGFCALAVSVLVTRE
jgi:hypothetical protein